MNKWSVDDDVNSDISGVTEVAAANSQSKVFFVLFFSLNFFWGIKITGVIEEIAVVA